MTDERVMLDIVAPVEGHKPRLSSRFSWPIGQEFLSRHLGDVPQAAELKIWFNDRPLGPRWTMEKIANQGKAYQILTARSFATGTTPQWYLMVYPVERSLRKEVKNLLEIDSMQQIHDFLTREQTATELMKNQEFRCVFNPYERTFKFNHSWGQ